MFKRNWQTGLLALTILAASTFYLYDGSLVQSVFTAVVIVNLLNFIFRADKLDSDNMAQPFVENPLEVILFSKDHLRVKGETIELDKIRKVVLDIENGKGTFHLPYNHGGKIVFNFPAKYLFKLKQQFRHHLPDVEYIR